MGVYAVVWILLGLGGWLRFAVVIPLLLIGFAYGCWRLATSGRPRLVAHGMWESGLLTPTGLLLTFSFVVLLAILGFASLMQPFGDSVAFYMAWAKVIAASGKIAPAHGFEVFSSVWMTAEAHFAALMLLGGEPALKFFVWVILLAGIHAIWLIAAECGCGPRGCLLAALVLATSTAVVNVTVDGKTDLIAVPPALSSTLWALRLGRSHQTAPAPVLAGWLAGTALGAKLSYIIPLGAAIATLVAFAAVNTPGPREVKLRYGIKWFLAIGLCAFVVSIPQLIRNYVLFNQPLLPIIGASFGREAWFADSTVRYILATLPISLTFGNFWAQHGNLSPLVLGLMPLLLLYPLDATGIEKELRVRVAVAAVVALASWFIVLPSQLAPRYFLGPLLLLAIPAAWAGERAWVGRRRTIGFCVVAFALAVTAIMVVDITKGYATASWRYLTAQATGGDTCLKEVNCAIAEVVNRQLRACLRRGFPRVGLRDSSEVGLILEPARWHARNGDGAPTRPI